MEFDISNASYLFIASLRTLKYPFREMEYFVRRTDSTDCVKIDDVEKKKQETNKKGGKGKAEELGREKRRLEAEENTDFCAGELYAHSRRIYSYAQEYYPASFESYSCRYVRHSRLSAGPFIWR